MKTEKTGFWKNVERLSEWLWDSRKLERIYNLCLILFWPAFIFWCMTVLARIFLYFITGI